MRYVKDESNAGQEDEVIEDEVIEELTIALEPHFGATDDDLVEPGYQHQINHLLETITRVGGEVCKMRAEVDGLLDQNAVLVESFQKLKAVISEKGSVDLDDFELACEVLGNSAELFKLQPIRKLAH